MNITAHEPPGRADAWPAKTHIVNAASYGMPVVYLFLKCFSVKIMIRGVAAMAYAATPYITIRYLGHGSLL